MAYQNNYPWESSYYNHQINAGTPAGTWRPNEQYSEYQSEQYNPVYPSFNGTSNFFSSSAQEYDAAPYRPSRTAATAGRSNRGAKTHQKPRRFDNQRRGKKTWEQNKFHLVTIDPDSNDKPTVSKIAEPAPIPIVKVARGNNKSVQSPRGGRGRGVNKKMPNFRLQGNEPESHYNTAWRGGRGRGGRGRGRGGRFQGPPKPSNDKDDINYVHLPDDAPAITLKVSSDNIVAFHGFDSVFTTQHSFPVVIDKKIYKSCDHYYQICKVTDLTGISSDKLNSGVKDENGKPIVEEPVEKDNKSPSAIAKEILKAASIDNKKIDEWRNTKGLAAVQRALSAKTSQSAHLREALKESGESILVHAYPRDSIYGTGCNVPTLKRWLDTLEKSSVKTLRIPGTFPLDENTVQHCPVFGEGRNVLGVILMQLREKVLKGEIEIVDMTGTYNVLRNNAAPAEPMEGVTTGNAFLTDTKSIGTF